jgi:hypothetical protein
MAKDRWGRTPYDDARMVTSKPHAIVSEMERRFSRAASMAPTKGVGVCEVSHQQPQGERHAGAQVGLRRNWSEMDLPVTGDDAGRLEKATPALGGA